MNALFLADLHLADDAHPSPLALLAEQYADLFASLDALYLLGDVFDYWLGFRSGERLYPQHLDAFPRLTRHCPVFVQRGNRDFLLNARDAHALGVRLLPDYATLNFHNADGGAQRMALIHGDILSKDAHYQRMRRRLKRRGMATLIRALPHRVKCKLAERERTSSPSLPPLDAKIDNHAIEALCHLWCPARICDITERMIICGHFHRPGLYEGNGYRIWQVGAWCDGAHPANGERKDAKSSQGAPLNAEPKASKGIWGVRLQDGQCSFVCLRV